MKITRVLRRETDCTERGVPIMAEIHPRELVLWIKGERKKYSLSYAALYWSAARREAEAAREAGRKRRK